MNTENHGPITVTTPAAAKSRAARPTLSQRIADDKAITVVLPNRFMTRNVWLGITRVEGGFILGAIDGVGNRYPICFGGVQHDTVYLSRRQAFEALEVRGHRINARYVAQPAATS